jgi:hypothetical protein
MRKRMFVWKVVCALCIISPFALIPAPARAALLDSETGLIAPASADPAQLAALRLRAAGLHCAQAEELLSHLSRSEVEELARRSTLPAWGGMVRASPLSTNEKVAIVLTLVILAAMVGFVEQSH